VELASRSHRSGRLTMTAPGHLFTISRAAEILGEEGLLWDLATYLDPEDGCPFSFRAKNSDLLQLIGVFL
jgi:hypothetical protein